MVIIYRKHNYVNKNISIIRDLTIREYDIKSAGMNILYTKGFIEDEEYKVLSEMDKLKRNIIIGKWLRDNPDVNKIMMDEFIQIRKQFFEANDLNNDDILSIKKDAIFVIDKKLNNLIFGNYVFVEKELYTSYFHLNKQEEYYYNKYKDILEVKGFSDDIKEFQSNYYFKLIKELMKNIKDKDRLFEILIEFKDDFLSKSLTKEYYKDVHENMYLFSMCGNTNILGLDEVDNNLLDLVNIDMNLKYINQIINVFL